MRQHEDLKFAELLGRIRIGSPTEDDIRLLLKRMITNQMESETVPEHYAPRPATMEEAANFFVDRWKEKDEIVALFSKVETVNQFNETVHKLLGLEVEEIRAVDVIQQRVTRKKGQRTRPYQQVGFRRKDWGRSKTSLSKLIEKKRKQGLIEGTQGGLPDKLRIAENSRVMLRRNIDVSCGLVNGAMGVVKELITDHKNQIINIMVKFDNLDHIVPIEKMSVPFDVSGELFATRTQFPLLVAYAVTIHKAQGMTTKNVLANIEDAFAKGMSYVALSRATSLNGVHLIGFHPNKISASVSALAEYKRLRETIGMDPLPDGNVHPQTRINFHSNKNRKTRAAPPVTCVLEEELSESTEPTILPKKRKTTGKRAAQTRTQLKKKTTNNRSSVIQEERNTTTKLRQQKTNQNLVNQSQKFIWFLNRGSDCFVNAVVWSVYYSAMGRRISSGDEANTICASFANIRLNGLEIVQSNAQLRECFPQYLEGRHAQHDAADFYRDLVANLPELVKRQMTVRKTTTSTCTSCLQEKTIDIENVAAVICLYSSSFSGIMEQMTARSEQNETCRTCDAITLHLRTVAFDAFLTKIVALEFGWADEEAPVLNRPDTVEMFDEDWKLVSAVEYMAGGRNGLNGHYISWVKNNDTWFTLDDQKKKEEEQENFKENHSGIKLMFFERLS